MKRLTLLLLLCLASPVFATSPSLIQFLAGGIMDSDGSPLTNGVAYFYEAGYANDPAHTKNVWTDFNKTATATYITLGGTGHAPGGATVFGDGLYDIVIKDSDGDTLCTLQRVDVYYFNPENLTASGTFTVTGDVTISDDLTVGDDAVVTGDLTVTGASTNFRNAIKAVDGSGSAIDADTVDTKHATDFVASSTYSAADVLTKLKTVDGTGSGLDADLLDGSHGTDFVSTGTYTAADVLTKLKTVDGVGSGLDADLLQGETLASITSRLSTLASVTIYVPYHDTGWHMVGAGGGVWTSAANTLPLDDNSWLMCYYKASGSDDIHPVTSRSDIGFSFSKADGSIKIVNSTAYDYYFRAIAYRIQ